MKKILFPLALLLLLASCNKKNANPVIPGTFSFTVNTVDYSGQTYDATYFANVDSPANYSFTGVLKAGTNGNVKSVGVNFSGTYYVQPGFYSIGTIGPFDNKLTPSYYLGNSIYAGKQGSVNVTQLDTVNNKISGTFQFMAINIASPFDTVTITNGKMDSVVYVQH